MYVLASRGLGDANQAAQTAGVIGSATAGTATAILGTLTAGGAVAPILGITAAAVPVIGAGLMAATLVIQYLIKNSGCGQTCIVTSAWANQAAAALQQVMDEYFALPAPRTEAQKAVAVAAFHGIWNTLVQQCGQAGTGDAGVRCISDRQQGACKWKQAYAPVYPGQPNIGECWNWWNGYLGPIQADQVVPDTVESTLSSAATSVSSSLESLFGTSGSGMNLLPVLLLAGLAIWAVN